MNCCFRSILQMDYNKHHLHNCFELYLVGILGQKSLRLSRGVDSHKIHVPLHHDYHWHLHLYQFADRDITLEQQHHGKKGPHGICTDQIRSYLRQWFGGFQAISIG